MHVNISLEQSVQKRHDCTIAYDKYSMTQLDTTFSLERGIMTHFGTVVSVAIAFMAQKRHNDAFWYRSFHSNGLHGTIWNKNRHNDTVFVCVCF